MVFRSWLPLTSRLRQRNGLARLKLTLVAAGQTIPRVLTTAPTLPGCRLRFLKRAGSIDRLKTVLQHVLPVTEAIFKGSASSHRHHRGRRRDHRKVQVLTPGGTL